MVIIGVLGISGVLASFATQTQKLLVGLAIGALAGLMVLLKWPNLGLLATLGAIFFIPFSGPGGLNAAVLMVAGLSGMWILDMIVRERRIHFNDPRTTTPVLVFIVSAIVSFAMGQLPWYPLARHAPLDAQVGGLALFVLSGLAFLLVANTMNGLKWLKAFTWLFVGIGAVYTLGRLVPPLTRLLRNVFQSGATTGSIFWVWLLIIPFSQALFNKDLHRYVRAALGGMVVAVLVVAVLGTSDWKSGYLPPLAGMAAIIAVLLRKRVVYFFPVLAILAIYAGSQAIATDEYSYFSRMEAWKIVLQLSMVNPIFGIGFGNYYWYTHLIPINGWHVNFNSHSQYVDIFSQTGIVGLLCFFWIFWEIGLLAWKLRDRAPEGFARAYVYGVIGGLVGTVVAGGLVDWILPFVYNIGMTGFRSSVLAWLFFGGLIVIKQLVEAKENQENSTALVPIEGRQE